MTLVFTLCSNNYLAQAITLGQSLLTHNPEYAFKIGLVDKKDNSIDYNSIPYEVIEVENASIDAFDDMFLRYNITELNTAVKPCYFKYFFNKSEVDRVIYIDPDIFVYQPFTELNAILDQKEIVLTPHFTTPIDDDYNQAENDFLNSGLYNLGFIALKRGENSKKLINWWAKRLETKAYIDFAKGMFTDQIWLNFAPLLFEEVEIFRHPGYNMAYWNMHERSLKDNNEVFYKNQTYKLTFFHFSGYNPLKPELLSKYQDRFNFSNREDIISLFNNYSKQLLQNNFKHYLTFRCYYIVKKEIIDNNIYAEKINKIPIYKKIIRRLILKTIKKFNIILDYSKI